MSASDHVGVTTPTPTGAFLRGLGRNEAGFRSWLVTWRAAFYRISWKREPRGFALAGKDERLRMGTTLSIVAVPSDEKGEALADAPPLAKELLEELQAQGRTLAAWSGA
jgi:hypothetical protein